MAKEKSSMSDNGTTKHHSSAAKKTSNKKLSHHLEDIDSLSCFKQKKSQDIDDKFNLLKSELQSLFYNPKAETSNCELRAQTVEKTDTLKKHKETIIRSKSSKFSEWLSQTIDKMDTKSKYSRSNNDLGSKFLLSTAQLGLQSKYDMKLMPQYKVERLLYKSFQLKNFNIYVVSSSDEDEGEQFQSKKTKKQKRIRKSSRAISAFPKKNSKRKRHSLESDIEIINLDSTLKSNKEKTIDYIDLVSYDWSKPFTNSASGNPELEIIEDSNEKINVKEQNDAEVEPKQNDSSACTQEPNSDNFISPNGKRAWECPICFESSQGQAIVATHCGHIFCQECLEKHNATKEKNCPTCRFDLSGKIPITLFNL